MNSNQRVLIIIPAYNEESNILRVVKQLKEIEYPVSYVVINDCSKDDTKKILLENSINHVDLPVNLGIGGAVQTGYIYANEAGYDIAIQLDGDGQHNPEYIINLIDALNKEDADVVIGSRFVENQGFQSTFMRRMGIKILSTLIKITTGQTVLDATSGFRATNRKGIELFARDYAQDYPEPEAIITASKAGLKTIEIPVVMEERSSGKSSIGGLSSLYYMIKVSIAIIICSLKKG